MISCPFCDKLVISSSTSKNIEDEDNDKDNFFCPTYLQTFPNFDYKPHYGRYRYGEDIIIYTYTCAPHYIEWVELFRETKVFKMSCSPNISLFKYDLQLTIPGGFDDFVKLVNRYKDLIIFS